MSTSGKPRRDRDFLGSDVDDSTSVKILRTWVNGESKTKDPSRGWCKREYPEENRRSSSKGPVLGFEEV